MNPFTTPGGGLRATATAAAMSRISMAYQEDKDNMKIELEQKYLSTI